MSGAERLVALFVAPAAEIPSGSAAEPDAAPTVDSGRRSVAVEHAGRPTATTSTGDGPARTRSRRKPRPGRSSPGVARGLRVVGAVPDVVAPPPASLDARAPTLPAEWAALGGRSDEAEPMPALSACGLQVCVIGGDRVGVAFGRALAARLARAPAARYAILGLAPESGSAAATVGLPASPARRAARDLVADGVEAVARGRVVEIALPEAADAVLERLAAVHRRAPDAPTVTLLPAARRSPFDVVVARQDLVLVVIAEGAPTGLSTLAVGELTRVAPGAVVRSVALPSRLGVPARRAAVRRALEGLR